MIYTENVCKNKTCLCQVGIKSGIYYSYRSDSIGSSEAAL